MILATRKARPISDIRVGDSVLSADTAGNTFYSEVIFVPHGPNAQRSLFTHISTASGRSIKMTSSHIIPSGPCTSNMPFPIVYAYEVRLGDCIMKVSGKETVSALEEVQGEGLYTIVTNAEYLVVNGIVVSPFAYNHAAANFFYNFHRFLYAVAPSLLTSSRLVLANEVSSRINLSLMRPLR